MSVVYTATAYPAGWLSDRFPRTALLTIGMAVLVVADVVLALAQGYGLLFTGIALWGLHLGLTQGILASLVADVAPSDYRGTAFGVFNLASGAGLLLASGVVGWTWDQHGPTLAFCVAAAFAFVAMGLTWPLGRRAASSTRE